MEIKSKEISQVEIDSLVNNPKNNNKHPKEQIERLAKLIQYQGFRNPVVVSNRTGFVVAGHGRIEAAKKLGMKTVPVMYQDFENEAQEYAYLTSDNAIALWAELDLSAVNTEMLDLGPDFDVDLLGIKDFVIEPIEKFEPQSDEDEVPEVVHPITRRGDIWLLGNHRLMCGDSTMIDDVEKLMNNGKADLVFYDPPYDLESIYSFMPTFDNCNYLVMSQRKFLYDSLKSSYENGFNFKFEYILYRKSPWLLNDNMPLVCHKNIFWFMNGDAYFDVKNKLEPWEEGKFRGNIKKTSCKNKDSYIQEQDPNGKRIKSVFEFQLKEEKNHPHQKPVEFMEYMICIHSKNTILDSFSGSGTSFIASEKANRKCYGMELDEKYCDVIINRWQNYTGKKATLESTRQTYEELKLERGA